MSTITITITHYAYTFAATLLPMYLIQFNQITVKHQFETFECFLLHMLKITVSLSMNDEHLECVCAPHFTWHDSNE